MTIFECLSDRQNWLEFYEYKVNGGHLAKKDIQDLWEFIEHEEYLPVVDKMRNPQEFPFPKMNILNKKNTDKKRIVYSYDRAENYTLKLLAYLLLDYDSVFLPNLYSFRKNTGVKKAVADLTGRDHVEKMYTYKVDIHDYFNSVEIEYLLPVLQNLWKEENELYQFIASILQNPYVEKDGTVIEMKKGIMAGLPIAPFLANIYLKEMDQYFWKQNILYARYSDDIIVFAETEELLQMYAETIESFLRMYHLQVNPSKVRFTEPEEEWEFLGFSFRNGIIDVSDVALQKIKGKLKRKARAIYRWKKNNHKCDEYAIRAYIKYFNRKFFDNPIHNEITWCRWYFPIINTDKSLHVIDRYMQDCIRYLTTGRYTKANYNLRYEGMKGLGYRSLVNEYYKQMKPWEDRI